MNRTVHLEKPEQRNEGVFMLRMETTDMELATARQRHPGVMTALPEAACNIPASGPRGKYGEIKHSESRYGCRVKDTYM